ncbi:MAG: ABC transporter substrate-binding protein [Patescibacteria group bacterium]
MSNTGKAIVGLIILVLLVIGLAYLGKASQSSAPTTTETPTPVVETGPIKVGVITPLTGDAAALGEFVKNVTDLAVEEVNTNNVINGRTFELVYEDGKCNGTGGANAMQKLVNADGVKIVIASDCSGAVLAGLPIAEQAKVFVFSGTATSPDLTNKSLFFARTVASDNGQGRVLAEAAIAHGWKKVAVLQESSDYALGIYRAFEANYPATAGTITKEEYPGTTTDFRSTLTKLRAANADALFIDPQSPGTAERILKQLADLKWSVPLLANDIVSGNADLITNHKTRLEGALVAEQGTASLPKSQKLDADYLKKYGKEMIYRNYAQAQYDLVYILAEGINKNGTDAGKIATWVRTVKDWPGASGLVTIGADGDRVGGHVLKVIKNGKAELAS